MTHLNRGLTLFDSFDRRPRDANSGREEFLGLTPGDAQITDSLAHMSECE
jgi:hypothetical protein